MSKILSMEKKYFIDLEVAGMFFGVIGATFVVAFIFNRLFAKFIKRSSIIIKNDPTNYQFLRHFLSAIIYVVGFGIAVYTVPNLRTLASSMLAGAGILAVAIGFASQQALSNIISGLFIVLFKPFRVNDRLQLRDTLVGVVEDITLRHTIIRNPENRRIIIPNSIMSEEVIINADYDDDKICKWLEIGISYDSDIDLARAIMIDEALRHPLHIDGRRQEQVLKGIPDVYVRVINLGDYAVNLRCYVWAKDNTDAFVMGCDLLESIKKRFDAEGVEIPFPYRTIVYKEAKDIPTEKIVEKVGDKNLAD